MTKYIIIAAGEATRWNNYMGITKHFAVLNGEPILIRAVRLLKENGVKAQDIELVSLDYNVEGVTNHHITPNYKENADADKFLSSAHLWNREGRTVIVYGDVYFSDYAMQRITNYEGKDWTMFCRPGTINNATAGECFAASFYPDEIDRGIAQLKELTRLYRAKQFSRIGGWEWSRLMSDVSRDKIWEHQLDLNVYDVIDDETDDLDFPRDYLRLKEVVG